MPVNKGAVAGGAVAGGAIGTAIMPGIGTVGGALVGGALGGLLSGGGGVEGYDGPQIDWSEYQRQRALQTQDRANQQQVAQQLAARAAGQGTSVAQSQLNQATAQNMAGARAQAASARGGALQQQAAQRQAMMAGAAAQQQSAGQAATLRAGEIAQAEQAYAGQVNAIRGMDQGSMNTELQQSMGVGSLQNQAAGINMQGKVAQSQNESGIIGGAMKFGGSLLSDMRAKEDIAPAGDDMAGFLDALQAKRYRYKPGMGEDGGQHFGIMAQDLEQAGPVGRSMVEPGPDGMKRIDMGHGFAALLASQAELNKRLEQLEQIKGRR